MERISPKQLFMLTMLFQIGSTVIFGFASNAGRDAWIATLISTGIGIFIIFIYTLLMQLLPGLTLVEWFQTQFGQWLGTPIAWLFPILFLYNAGRTLGDVKDLLITTILPGTPEWIVLGLFMIAITYVLLSGIEVIARLAEMILPVILLLFFIEIILIFGSHTIHFERLQPILGEGWGRVWKAVWPLGILQSFGETIAFAMIWPLTKQPERIRKTTILATILFGMSITIFDVLAILTFGEGTFSSSSYPLFRLAKVISIADFLENLDALGILYFVSTAFFKTTLQMYTAIRGIQQLMYIHNSHLLIYPTAVIVLYLGLTISKSTAEHVFSAMKIFPC
ncbi:GerAB/ArcD/ProY family transporter [Paenibacillus sp. LMG 31458]|uniref:GerAB/ArcD/ProY family transporter n=1 Tax=Paenibacillus phytorum TaxID=2654977 RepID=A0ABX1YA45_9BACL|nr:GerAB/ArcD/ProY family transporter [Paenibacillus phytorum]NOU76699.1 GerAB/ArcD/ProY family transporter [Paenibacillus phytorum]